MGFFQVLKTKVGKANNVVADAAFKSQSKREVINVRYASKMPAPCKSEIMSSLRAM